MPRPACGRDLERCQCPGSKGLAIIAHVNAERLGFLREEEIAILATDPATHTTRLLVRCGGCRFIASADQTPHLINIITREGSDYVRDVALLSERTL